MNVVEALKTLLENSSLNDHKYNQVGSHAAKEEYFHQHLHFDCIYLKVALTYRSLRLVEERSSITLHMYSSFCLVGIRLEVFLLCLGD